MRDERWKNQYRNGPSCQPVWKFSRKQRQAHVERVAVYRDKLEEAGVFPFVRYFWGPRASDEEIRLAAPLLMPDGSKPKTMSDLFRLVYRPDAIEPLAFDSPLMKMVPLTVGLPLSHPIILKR